MCPHRRQRVPSLEWRSAGEAFVEDASERVDVASCVDRFATDLLRRGIADGADEAIVARDVVLERDPCHAEVGDVRVLAFPYLVEEDVPWLDVPVDEAVSVCCIEGGRDLADDLGSTSASSLPSCRMREPRSPPGASFIATKTTPSSSPASNTGRRCRCATARAMRVSPPEPVQLGVAPGRSGHQLERNRLGVLRVRCAVNDPHSASTEDRLDGITADGLRGHDFAADCHRVATVTDHL